MVGLISSTIFPSAKLAYGGPRSVFSPEQRLEQTLVTIESLLSTGIHNIFLIDNSGHAWQSWADAKLTSVKIIRFAHYQLNNKGINEFLLLHQALEFIPHSEPVLKLSGRYRLLADFRSYLGKAHFAGRMLHAADGRKFLHTSCYLARNAAILGQLLEGAIIEQYSYYSRVIGFRSFARLLVNSALPSRRAFFFHDPPDPIEFAAARTLRYQKSEFVEIPFPIATGPAGANPGFTHTH